MIQLAEYHTSEEDLHEALAVLQDALRLANPTNYIQDIQEDVR